MKLSFRLLLPCLLAGSGLLLLSGCDQYDDDERGGGREYHQHAYNSSYRTDRVYNDGPSYSGRRYETVDRSDRYDRGQDYNDRYDRHDRRTTYEDNSRTVVVAPRDSSPYRTRSGSGHSRTYASATSGNSYPSHTRSGSGSGYSRTSNAAVAPTASYGGRSGTHHAPPTTRTSTNVAVNVSTQNKQGGSKSKEKGKDKKKD